MFKTVSQPPKVAAAAAQQFINLIDPTLQVKVDGVVGEKTKNAFKALSSESRVAVTSMLKARNPDVAKAIVASGPLTGNGNWVDQATVYGFITRAVEAYGDVELSGSTTVDFLRWKLELEAAKTTRDGVRYYNASAVNAQGYTGLFQVGRAAYTDVARSGRIANLPIYGVAAVDPWLNTVMALVYAQQCFRDLRSGNRSTGVPPYKGPITREVLYAAYNQGVTGFMQGAKNALMSGGQSAQATPIIASALRLVKSHLA